MWREGGRGNQTKTSQQLTVTCSFQSGLIIVSDESQTAFPCKRSTRPPGVAPSLRCSADEEVTHRWTGVKNDVQATTEPPSRCKTKPERSSSQLRRVDLRRRQLRLHIKRTFQGAYKYLMVLPQLAPRLVNPHLRKYQPTYPFVSRLLEGVPLPGSPLENGAKTKQTGSYRLSGYVSV